MRACIRGGGEGAGVASSVCEVRIKSQMISSVARRICGNLGMRVGSALCTECPTVGTGKKNYIYKSVIIRILIHILKNVYPNFCVTQLCIPVEIKKKITQSTYFTSLYTHVYFTQLNTIPIPIRTNINE